MSASASRLATRPPSSLSLSLSSPALRFGLSFRAHLQTASSRQKPQFNKSFSSSSVARWPKASGTSGSGSGSGAARKGGSSDAGAGAGAGAGKASSGARVLEKPDRFRPPSHAAKLRSRTAPIRQYGPDLTAEERAAQRAKQYPNMMPPEGSWGHWFLSNRGLHLGFTMFILLSCGLWALILNIKNTSPFATMLPSPSNFFVHPLDTIYQTIQVMKLSSEHTSRLTAEKRRRELEEVAKRKAYRVAHGIEGMDGIDEADPVFAAALASRLEREERERERRGSRGVEGDEGSEELGQGQGQGQSRKKWLGIW